MPDIDPAKAHPGLLSPVERFSLCVSLSRAQHPRIGTGGTGTFWMSVVRY